MNYRRLGSSDLEVSEISLGSWLTFAGGVGFEQTRACTDSAFEAGINFFDTANVYGRGAAESAWGEILSGRPRPVGGADRQADRRLAGPPADRLRRPLPGAPLRPGRPDRGDDRGLPAGRRLRQGPLPRLQRVDARADPGGDRHRRARPVRLLAAAVLHALAGARGRDLPALRSERDLANRLVAARAGAAYRQVPPRPGAAARLARSAQRDGRLDQARDERHDARGRRPPAADRRRGRALDGRARARLGPAAPRARLGDRRRITARADPRQREGV